MQFVSWDVIYHKSTLSKTLFSFIFAAGNYFHFWNRTIFNVCCIMHRFCSFYFCFFYYILVNLPSIFITLFVKCFSPICKKNTHAQISLQSEMNCLYGKKCPTKARSWFYEIGIPLRCESLFSYTQILIFQ